MFIVIGWVVVLACVLGGYVAMGGHIAVLIQPFELVIIGGAAVGAFITSNPKSVLSGAGKAVGIAMKGPANKKADYLELLSMLYATFKLARTKGNLALEQHVEHPHESELFALFPRFAANHHAVEFFCDYLRMLTMGSDNTYEIEAMMDEELETHHKEDNQVADAVQSVADALPALGIVAAVLGVIKIMGSITEPPEILGKLIGGALVGTFLGVLMAYGFVGPLASSIRATQGANARYLQCIKAGLIAHMQGYAPAISVEFARKALLNDVRPTFVEVEDAVSAVPPIGLQGGSAAMAGANDQQAIIINRVKGGHAHAHHGGAWKVAYADFVTAMMAFFLLLWLLNATTEEQKSGISNYFSPDSVSQSKSGAGGVLGGTTVSLNGVLTANGGPTFGAPLWSVPTTSSEESDADEDGGVAEGEEKGERRGETEGTAQGGLGEATLPLPGRVDSKDLDKLLAEREEERFEAAAAALRQAIESVPELAKLSENLLIDQTPEGLRIQLVDQEQYSMSPLGSTEPNEQARRLFAMVAQVVGKMPNRVSVSGHTDARPYRSERGYTNWELSADRANAARRLLAEGGLPVERIALVQGRSDTEPLVPDDPMSALNRRISLVLLREATDKGGPRIGAAGEAAPRRADAPAAAPPDGTRTPAQAEENRAETPLPSLFGRRPG